MTNAHKTNPNHKAGRNMERAMTVEEKSVEVTTITGDHEIQRILQQEAALVVPAFACQYDGFVNDVFSEYANPSILRPASVRKAQLRSELSAYFYNEDAD